MPKVINNYTGSSITPVKDFSDFIGSGLPEIPKLKALVTAIKSVFKVQDVQLQLYFIEGRRYRVDIFTSKSKKVLISSVYFLPNENQVHVYDNLGNMLLASEKKKPIYSSIPYTLDYIGAGDKLRNIILSV
jgi:hypothetical protein